MACYSYKEGDITIATLGDLECVFKNVLTYIMPLAVVILFVMLISGGIGYLFAHDNPKAAEKAQKTITSAILGLVLLIGIWLILKFIEILTGVKVTEFKIIQN